MKKFILVYKHKEIGKYIIDEKKNDIPYFFLESVTLSDKIITFTFNRVFLKPKNIFVINMSLDNDEMEYLVDSNTVIVSSDNDISKFILIIKE